MHRRQHEGSRAGQFSFGGTLENGVEKCQSNFRGIGVGRIVAAIARARVGSHECDFASQT